MSQTQSAAAIAGTLKQGKVVHVNTGQSFSGVSSFFLSLVSPGFLENWHTETGKGGAQYHWSVSWGVGVGGSVLVSLKTGSTKQGKVGHIITGPSFLENCYTKTGKSGAHYHWSVLVSLKSGTLKQGKVGHIITGQSWLPWKHHFLHVTSFLLFFSLLKNLLCKLHQNILIFFLVHDGYDTALFLSCAWWLWYCWSMSKQFCHICTSSDIR